MEKKILRVGIVGCGGIFRSHFHAYPDQNCVVTGFYDRINHRAQEWKDKFADEMQLVKEDALEKNDENDEIHLKRCKIFEKEAKVYDNFQELLNNVDVIDISTPNYAHAPYAIWALNQNKSVMSEKPPALCSLETRWICEKVKHSKGHYQINENFLWKVFVRELKKVINSGVLGEIKKINIKLGHGGPSWGWQAHFLNPSTSGGGVLSDMGIHALGIVFGLIGHDYQIKKIQSLRMESTSKPERIMKESEGNNEYYMQRFMVEDEAEIKVGMLNKRSNKTISILLEVSWAKTYKMISIEGSKAKCHIEENDNKESFIAISKNNGDQQIIKMTGQGRDSHQLEIIDFLTCISKNEDSFANENIAHNMQTIVSASYLSNLRKFELKGQKGKGIPITPDDLDEFYQNIIDSGCPKNIILEEIIYRFMSPFTSGFFKSKE